LLNVLKNLVCILMGASLLAGCGGGDATPAPAPTPIVTPPIPAPVPTPLPTPLPMPQPAPISYERAFDLSRDRAFNLSGAEMSYTIKTGQSSNDTRYLAIDARPQEDSAGVRLTYTAALEQTALTIGSAGPILFERPQINRVRSDALIYNSPASNFSLAQPGPNFGLFPAPLQYVVLVRQDQQSPTGGDTAAAIERAYVAGAATQPQDIPATGLATYAVMVIANRVNETSRRVFLANQVNLQVSFPTQTVTAKIEVVSQQDPGDRSAITLDFLGQINPLTGRVVGSVNGSDGSAGTFYGRLYGPAGTELGVTFVAQRVSERMIGWTIGTRR
jgi:hypothetical protein